ncbi:hypothetical protein H4R26_005201, partial [Coemansia thaxteri]
NLRQRFFTPHCYLLRWAHPRTDARSLKRAVKCLMNAKTRESIHGIFVGEERADAGDGCGAALAKSVNYYSDIFRRQAPELWATSVDAYRLYAADRELQSGDVAGSGSGSESPQRPKRRRASGGSSNAAMLETPVSSLATDFSSDAGSEDGACDHVLVSVAGHSWHKFLGLRSRWASVGLRYSGRDDWVRREAAFLVQHVLTQGAVGAVDAAGAEVALAVVPFFVGTFDAANIEMAVGRARATRTVRVASLVDDLVACIAGVESKEPFSVLSLCRLTDRQTRTATTLALLASHGSNTQRFGMFPHNDSMLARLVAGSEGLWHEYRELPGGESDAGAGLMPMAPMAPIAAPCVSPTPRVAFSYAQSGIKYSFMVRREGHFFEMTRGESCWVPTMAPDAPRAVWAARTVPRDALLGILRHDTEKMVTAMVELYGLRSFCFGFFDGVAVPSVAAKAGGAAMALPARRISDDPVMLAGGCDSSRRSSSSARARRARASAGGAVGGSNGSNGGSGLPYRRPAGSHNHNHNHNQQQQQQQAAAAAMPFLSPQAHPCHSFSAVDVAAMSVSLPNSPFVGFPLDNNGGSVAHDALFASLSDAAFAASGARPDEAAAAQAAAATAAAVAAACLLPAHHDAPYRAPHLGSAGGSSAMPSSPAFWDVSHIGLGHSHHHPQPQLHASLTPAMGALSMPLGHVADMQMGFGSPHSMTGLTSGMTEMSVAPSSVALYPPQFSAGGPGPAECSSGAGPASVALYPPPFPGMFAGHSSSSSSAAAADILMHHFAQPSPSLTHYNLSAQATPAFESCSVPMQLHHASPQSVAHAAAAAPSPYHAFLIHTPVSAAPITHPLSLPPQTLPHPSAVVSSTEADDQSAMAAYFGAAPNNRPALA